MLELRISAVVTRRNSSFKYLKFISAWTYSVNSHCRYLKLEWWTSVMTIADGKSAVVDIWIALCDEEELTYRYLLKWLAVLWGPEASSSRGKTCQKLWSKIFFGFSSYNHHGVGSWPAYWSHSRLKAGCDRALYRGHIIFWECSQASILSNPCYIKAASPNPRQYTICYSTNWLSFKPSLITSKSLGDGLLFENTCFFGNCANPVWCTEVNNTELSVEIYLWVCFWFFFQQKCSLKRFGKESKYSTIGGD